MTLFFSKVQTTSTAIVLYDPNFPHTFIKADLEKIEAIKRTASKALEELFINTYKALYLSGKETLQSRLIRSALAFFPTHTEKEMVQRFLNYSKVTGHLNRLTNEQLSVLLKHAKSLGSSICGDVLLIEVEGIPVFIKKIHLTDIERENPRSTKNIFKLPLYYQYGVGSLGFGVWREISAYEMTSKWVLNGECQNFPLMYHSRILNHPSARSKLTTEEIEDRQRYVKYWNDSSAVGNRFDAVSTATASVVVFMENFPQNLYEWFNNGLIMGGGQALLRIERELNLVAAFMKSRGFLHFDAHFRNILYNNNHVYFADFGLVMSQRFDLSMEERAFLRKHIDYDLYYVVAELAQIVITATLRDEKRKVALDTYLSYDRKTIALPPIIGSIAQRYRPIAVLMVSFFESLREHSKSTPYPETELALKLRKLCFI